MANEFDSTLGFDASGAIKTFQLLETIVSAYTKALLANLSAAGNFNSEQKVLETTLELIAKSAKDATTSFESYAKSVNDAAKAESKAAGRDAFRKNLEANQRAAVATQNVLNRLNAQRTGAPVAQLANFDSSVESLQNLIKQTGATRSQVTQILNNLGGQYEGTMAQIRNAIVSVVQATGQLGGQNALNPLVQQVTGLGAAAQQAGNQGAQGIGRMQTAAQGLLLSWQSVTRIFVGQAIFRGISAMSNELKESVSRARDLQIQLAQIQTIAGRDLKIGGLGAVGDLTRQLSGDFGIDRVEAADAIYEAFSNQLGDTADVMSFLSETAKLAKATVTDFGTASSVTASVLNAYNLSTDHAARVTDLLFKTVDVSAAKLGEFEGALGRVLPTAKQLGVTLEEVFAGFSTISIQGVDTNTALTQILNIMKGIIKPSGILAARFRELGVASAEIGVAKFGGIFPFLKEIVKDAQSLNEIAGQFDDIREFQGVLAALSNDSEILDRNLKDLNQTAGATDKAFQFINDTPAQQLNKSIQVFKNLITDTLGNTLLDVINQVIASLGGAEGAAKAFIAVLTTGAIAATALIGGQLLVVIGSATAGMLALAGATGFLATALGGIAVFAGIAAVTGAIVYLGTTMLTAGDSATKLKNKIDEINKSGAETAKAIARDQQNIAKEAIAADAKVTQALLQALSERSEAYGQVVQVADSAEKSITKNLDSQLSQRLKSMDKYISDVTKSIEDQADKIKKVDDSLRDFQNQIRGDRLGDNLRAAKDDPKKQADLLRQEAGRLEAAFKKALSFGNFDEAEKFLKDSRDVANDLSRIEGQRNSAESVRKNLLKNAATLSDEQKKNINETAEANQKQLPTLESQRDALGSIVDQIKEVNKELEKSPASADKTALQDKLKALTTEFSKQLENSDFDSKIKEKFRGLSGEKIELNLVVDQGIATIKNILAQEDFSIEVKLKLGGILGLKEVNPDTVQAAVTNNNKALEDARLRAADVLPKKTELDAAGAALIASLNAIKTEARSLIPTTSDGLAVYIKNLFSGANNQIDLSQSLGKTLTDQVTKLQSQIETALANGDNKALTEIQTKIAAFAEANKDNPLLGNFVKELATLDTQISNVQAKADAFGKAFTAQQQVNELSSIQTKLIETVPSYDAVIKKMNEQNEAAKALGPASQQGVNVSVSGLQVFIAKVNEAKAAQAALNAEAAKGPQGGGGGGGSTTPQVDKALGGMIHYFSRGGFTPRGTDTVPAMLTPGEFVVNAASTRRFYSELMAINSGRAPVYREQGGMVSNSFGDININLPAGTSETHARQVIQRVQRELRRGSSRLR